MSTETNPLSHLSESEMTRLIERYYAGEKVKDLAENFNLTLKNNQLVQHFPAKQLDENCPYCSTGMYQPYKSRDGYSNAKKYCRKCEHTESTWGACHCEGCKKTRIQQQQEKERIKLENRQKEQEKLSNAFEYFENLEAVSLQELTLKERTALGAYSRLCLSDDLTYLKPVLTGNINFSPTLDYTIECIKTLCNKNIILPSSISPPEHFFLNSEGSFSYDMLQVHYEINIKEEGLNKVPLLDEVMSPSLNLNPNEAFELWKEIALHECIESLKYNVQVTLNHEIKIGDKTVLTIKEMLKNFSVAQIFFIFYSRTTYALRWMTEQGVFAQHAANSIIGNSQKYADRAIANQYNIKGSWRSQKSLPQSAISTFLFDRVLKIGDDGFEMPPNIERIRRALKTENDSTLDYPDDDNNAPPPAEEM